ncbi:hypothetical protein D046_2367, partial [Vibrio parahaemolyticus V-223/04]
SQRRWMVSLCC